MKPSQTATFIVFLFNLSDSAEFHSDEAAQGELFGI